MMSFSNLNNLLFTSAMIWVRLFTSSKMDYFSQKFPSLRPLLRNILMISAVFSMLLLSSSDYILKYSSNLPILFLKLSKERPTKMIS